MKKRVMVAKWIQSFRWIIAAWVLFTGTVSVVKGIDIDRICPRMLHKVFNGYAPIGKFINLQLTTQLN